MDHTVHREAIEPTAAYLVSRWWAKCESAPDEIALKDACQTYWFGVRTLSRLSCLTPEARHFGVVMTNEVRRAAHYIEEKIGLNPFKTWRVPAG